MNTSASCVGCMAVLSYAAARLAIRAGRDRQGEPEHRAARMVRRVGQKSAMLLHHGTAQAQAQAHAFDLGREKRREQLLGHLGRDAAPGVGNRKLQPAMGMRRALARRRAAHPQLQHPSRLRHVAHRLHRIARQVQQHLLDHGAVAPQRRQIRRRPARLVRTYSLRACSCTSGMMASSTTCTSTASRSRSRRRTKSCTLLMILPARWAWSAIWRKPSSSTCLDRRWQAGLGSRLRVGTARRWQAPESHAAAPGCAAC